jgi:predicted dehydrogenase
MTKLKLGIYGMNGHQIWKFLDGYDRVEFVAAAAVPATRLEEYSAYKNGTLKIFETLDEMIDGCELDLVCLCSPIRKNQARDAIKLLNHNISVYAEKPAALTEDELDEILEANKKSKAEFHEIADSAFVEPYFSLRRLISEGAIGEVVQIYVQKSYPACFPNRPNDPDVDGGLTRQAGVHATRFIEHCCGLKIKDVKSYETTLGAPDDKEGFVTASSSVMTLENGGVASMCINYFNQRTFPAWGNECVRAFGTGGMIEITDGGRRTHLYTPEGDMGEFVSNENQNPKPFFELLCEHLLDGTPMPFSLEDELSPLRKIIRIHEAREVVR